MTYEQIAKEIENLFRTLQGIIIAALVYFGAFVVAAVPAVFTGIGVASLFEGVTSHSALIGWLIGIALEVVNIIVIHTASEFYSDKPTGRFWVLVSLIPVYVFGVEWVMYYSDGAFPELVRSLGMVSPFFAIAVFIAVMFNQWHKVTQARAEQTAEDETRRIMELEAQERQRQIEIEDQERAWQHEQERLALEQKHAEKLARIEAKRVSGGVSQTVSNNSPKMSQSEMIDYILSQLQDRGNETQMTQLAGQLGISRSTLYRRLDRMQQDGLIHKNGEGWKVNQ